MRHERYFGSLYRQVYLGRDLDADAAQAKFTVVQVDGAMAPVSIARSHSPCPWTSSVRNGMADA